MIKYIIKRNSEIKVFDRERIVNAVLKALTNIYLDRNVDELKRFANVVADEVIYKLEKKYATNEDNDDSNEIYPNVEEVQDIVENVLIKMGEVKVVKEYIVYRSKHKELRENKSMIIDVEKMFTEYTNKLDWKINENANTGYSIQGLNNYIHEEVTKNIWLNKIYPEPIKEAHVNGNIHIHDLGYFGSYCCGWSLEDLLLRGFQGVSNKIESKPAKHFRSILGQLYNFLYTLQGESAGAQAVSSFDTYLAPFIRYDQLTYKEVKQAMQEFIFNINVPTRVGFQTPFINITLDLQCPKTLENTPVIIGGENWNNYLYSEFQKEMDLLNKAFCEVMMEGDSKERIFTFPIPTYNISKDFDWNRPIINDVMNMTAKYGTPYFANFVNSDMSPEDARSMCCRLRLDNRVLIKRGGGLFGSNPLTGSIGVVTINLPRLGYLSETEEEFMFKLRKLMDLAKNSLEIKRKVIEKNIQSGLYPYSRYYLDVVYKRFGEYYKNHFCTIGINGMNEAIMNLYNESENITTKKGKDFANKVLEYMRNVMIEYQEETGSLYNLEATPAEGTAYRLARIDKQDFPDIITAGDTEPYYTNSTQLPVGFTEDLFMALDIQESLQTKYTGGTVFHAFLGEKVESSQACKQLIKKVMENYSIPYFTISPTFSVCSEHGYLTGEQHVCPICKKETEVWTRIVGYHRPIKSWNKGKQEEFKDRVTFNKIDNKEYAS